MTPLIVICIYLALLLALGVVSNRYFRGTSRDYFVASNSIGPFLLLMSVFGTTMTAFALVGSTGKSFERGIGVYGLMASASGLVHAVVFFMIGIRLWTYGKRFGYVTQIQYFRARFESSKLGYLLFPVLVGLVVPYLLIGVIGAAKTILPVTAGAFPQLFPNPATPQWAGGIPPWLTGLVVCAVVLTYVFAGGSRGAAWANTFQTLVFMVMGIVAFVFITNALGGLRQANDIPATIQPDGSIVQTYAFDPESSSVIKRDVPKVIGHVTNPPDKAVQPHLSRQQFDAEFIRVNPLTKEKSTFTRELGVPPWMFFTYLLIPLSVGMFPHLFQHWLTAKSARTFRLTVVAHPLCIMIVWVPCVLIGAWATGLMPPGIPVAAVLANMVNELIHSPLLTGLLTAGIMAAIMSSLDSQFLCLGTIFTNDIVLHARPNHRMTDRQIVWIARSFVVVIVAATYGLAMFALAHDANVFDLGVWCFSGFSSLFPLVFAAVFWKRATLAGAVASILAAVGVWVYFLHLSGWGGELTVANGVMPVTFSFLAAVVAMVGVSLFTSPPSPQTIEKFFPSSDSESPTT